MDGTREGVAGVIGDRPDAAAGLRAAGLTPYFEAGGVALYHAEEVDFLPALPAGSIDDLITDPPYCSGGATAGARSKDPASKYCQNGDARGRPNFAGDHLDQRSFAFWSTLWLRLAYRALRDGGRAIVFSDWRQMPMTSDVLQAGGFIWRGVTPWDKGRGARAPHTGYMRHQAEYALWGTKGACPRADGRGPFDGVIASPARRGSKLHITAKPLDVMRALVRTTGPGSLILEPFAGSSTTAVAAALEGRRAVACEREEANCEISARRLERAIRDGEDPPASAVATWAA